MKRRFSTGLAITLLAAQACGSDDGKRAVSASDGGIGGEAGTPNATDSGGSSAGASLSTAGEPPTSLAGMGGAGSEPVDGITAGAAGESHLPILPAAELLFSVKPGARGLANSDLGAATLKHNFIYTSRTGSQSATPGTNAVKFTGESMGLDADDQIVSFALMQAEPQSPNYLFSVADGSEGASPTRVYQAYWDEAQTAQGDVYFSDGAQSLRNLGEGGDEYGYNALLASELSLGLSLGEGAPADDLTGLAVHDADAPIKELYFTVSGNALGATNSAVSTIGEEERPCTVFKTTLDGTNSIAFGCTELGLQADQDEIDALAVYGAATPTKVVFSVTMSSQGLVDSGIDIARLVEGRRIGAALFSSTGNGANTLVKVARDLGLGDNADDELDGLAVVEAPAKPRIIHAANCSLTYDPRDAVAGGGLNYVNGTSRVGQDVMVLYGQTTAQQNRLIAYDATSCAFLQQVDLPSGFENLTDIAIVPLAGWSAAKPLDKVEYLRAAPGYISPKELLRFDAAGTLLKTFPISNTDYTYPVAALIYEPVGDRLYLLMRNDGDGFPRQQLAIVPRPAIDADATTLDSSSGFLSAPCADAGDLNGTDANGNLYVARRQTAVTDYLVCAFTPNGELMTPPYSWSSDAATDGRGLIVPGGSSFLLRSASRPIVIERGAHQAP